MIGAASWILILGYSISCGAVAADHKNSKDAAIRDYARIEWHGNTATLIAGGAHSLDMAAGALATCLNVSVSAEDPQYRYAGDLLDLSAPQWSAQHPAESHFYAPKPSHLNISFGVYQGGRPKDLTQLLQDTAHQMNQQQPYGYTVLEQRHGGRHYFSFTPTRTRSETGALIEVPAYLDQKITIPLQTSRVASLASELAQKLSQGSGLQFDCCQSLAGGLPWGSVYTTYQATDLPAREVLEDLMDRIGITQSYSLRCRPLNKRFCFMEVMPVSSDRKPKGDGVCAADGFEGY